jgi:hypothetical protein
VYIPPVDSVEWRQVGAEAWQDAYSDLQADVAAYQNLGEVCLFGDYNARTSTADDTGVATQQVLDSMGVLAGQVAPVPVRDRRNTDQRPVCSFGQKLLALFAATNSIILNGRTAGDPTGAATFVSSRSVSGDGGSGSAEAGNSSSSSKRRKKCKSATAVCRSVIDYGIVSRSLFPRVYNFAVVSSC